MINTMARVTIINQFYTPDISPTAHLSASLAEHLAGDGYEVTVVTSRGGYTKSAQVRDAASEGGEDADRAGRHGSLTIHRIWTPRLGKATILKRCLDYSCFYAGALGRMITLPKQDVIISLTTPPYIAWTGVMHKLLHHKARLVLWCMDCYPDAAERLDVIRTGGLLSRVMRWMNRALFRRIDHLISLDSAMEELLVSQYAPKNQTLPATVIPNWEPAALFPRDLDPPRWETADELGLADKFVVLYLGNAGYGHHFKSVLEAAEGLRDEPVAFVFVGGGKRWHEIDAAVRERKLANVTLHAYVPKETTPSVMAAADCALITLRDKSLGVMSPSKLHSYLALGLPVVYLGPRGGNVDEAIARFGCGLSLRSEDGDGVVRFIRENMARGEGYQMLRRKAREAFDTAYIDHAVLPEFTTIIDELHHSRPEPVPSAGGRGLR